MAPLVRCLEVTEKIAEVEGPGREQLARGGPEGPEAGGLAVVVLADGPATAAPIRREST